VRRTENNDGRSESRASQPFKGEPTLPRKDVPTGTPPTSAPASTVKYWFRWFMDDQNRLRFYIVTKPRGKAKALNARFFDSISHAEAYIQGLRDSEN
jgi:hypothetical protein